MYYFFSICILITAIFCKLAYYVTAPLGKLFNLKFEVEYWQRKVTHLCFVSTCQKTSRELRFINPFFFPVVQLMVVLFIG